MEEPAKRDWKRWLTANGPYLAAIAAVVLWCALHDPISRRGSHAGRMVLAGVALVIIHIAWRLRELGHEVDWPFSRGRTASWPVKLLFAGWISAAIWGVFNYYQFDRRVVATVGDYADATYYYLNSKYFDELGYTELYRAMLVADAEGPKRLQEVRRYRDLVGYEKLYPRQRALQDAAAVKARFTPERWREFSSDLSFITSRRAAGGWSYFFIDHGYNPPPPWTLIGGAMSDATAVGDMKRITMVDFFLVAGLMIAIGLAFGPEAVLACLLFFVVTFSGRWPILGQSILRFDWLVALVGSVVALKKERHGLAGGLMAYAVLNRIFPAIFALPYVVAMVRDWVRERRLARSYRRFLIGGTVVALLIGGGALVRYGGGAYRDAAVNLKMHGSPESFSSHRVGLGDVLLYRGEWTRKEMNARGGIEGKRDQLWEINPWLRVAGGLAVLFVVVVVWRSRAEVHRVIWLAVLPLFCLTNPQINYYNLRLLLVLFHVERWGEYRHKVGLYLLFGTEMATQAVMVARATRYAVTATTSIGLAIYLAVMVGFLVSDLRAGRMERTLG